jgi:Helix-turn-helix of DDE superfamily endonuclease/DDE superfamily endonuclease
MLFYRAALPLSSKTLTFVAGIIRRHRISTGSLWRKLNPGRQALLVLAYLRKGETFAELAAGFGVGTATAWRYVNETVALLAARAPKLRRAVRDAKKAGHAYVVIDGTLIPIDRVAADRPFYSGKHKKHGMNLQVMASPGGDVLWVPGALPDRCTTREPSGSGASWPGWRPQGWSSSPARATKDRRTRRSRTRGRTSRSYRKTPIRRTRNSAHPAKGQTRSSRPGGSSANSAAAPGAPGNSPRPSTYCRPARQNAG